MKWKRQEDADCFGRTGFAWVSDCGRVRIVDGCGDGTPFEVQLRDERGRYRAVEPWRPSLPSAKRAAAKLLEAS